MTEKIDPKLMARSLTGFDEIAIRKAFGDNFEKLEGMFAARSLLFIQYRRDGASDRDAFKASMDATIGEISDLMDPDAEGNADGSTMPPMSSEIGPTPTS